MLHVSSLYGFLSDVIRNCDLDFDLLTSKTGPRVARASVSLTFPQNFILE